MKFLSWIAWTTLLVATGCDSNRLFEENTEFKDRCWKVTEPVAYDFKINDATKSYNLYFNIRNDLDYPYARLFVNTVLKDSLGNVTYKKLSSEYLFDQKTGEPFGRSGLGDVYDHQFLFLKDYTFKSPGRYSLKLEQYMRQDTLMGIVAAGFRLEEAVKEK